jgi:hypothetical protein
MIGRGSFPMSLDEDAQEKSTNRLFSLLNSAVRYQRIRAPRSRDSLTQAQKIVVNQEDRRLDPHN